MKLIIQILLVLAISLNSVASYPIYPITIRSETAASMTFWVKTPPAGGFQKDRMYFLYDGDRLFTAINAGTTDKGESSWKDINLVPDVEHSENGTDFITPNIVKNSDSSEEKNGYFDEDAHNGALGVAIQTGVAHAIYKGVIFDSKFESRMGQLDGQIKDSQKQSQENYDSIKISMASLGGKFNDTFKQISAAAKSSNNGGYVGIQYQSQDKNLVDALKGIEGVLNTSFAPDIKRQASRNWGYKMIKASDAASAAGDHESADAFLKFSEALADITIGLDPITGPIRDTYEAFTGKNLITGEQLDTLSRTMAIVGAVTFGFGSKIGKGVRIVAKMANSTHFVEAATRAGIVAGHMEQKFRPAQSRYLYEKYLTELRRVWERPVVHDPKLQRIVYKRLWKDGATIGNGSTMTAIRLERMEGKAVKGRFHTQKGQEELGNLLDWLKNNPNAIATDRHAAENLVRDLQDALTGEL